MFCVNVGALVLCFAVLLRIGANVLYCVSVLGGTTLWIVFGVHLCVHVGVCGV